MPKPRRTVPVINGLIHIENPHKNIGLSPALYIKVGFLYNGVMLTNSPQDKFADAKMDGNIVRWKSNDRIPFPDMLQEFLGAGLITTNQYLISCRVRKDEDAKAIAAYAEFREKNGYSDEEKAEMRAAFGPNASVVCAFTGKRIVL